MEEEETELSPEDLPSEEKDMEEFENDEDDDILS